MKQKSTNTDKYGQLWTNINKRQQISTTTNKYKQISTTGIWRNTKKYQQRQEKWRTIKEYQQISINIKVETVVDPPVAFQTHFTCLTMRILCENDIKRRKKKKNKHKSSWLRNKEIIKKERISERTVGQYKEIARTCYKYN